MYPHKHIHQAKSESMLLALVLCSTVAVAYCHVSCFSSFTSKVRWLQNVFARRPTQQASALQLRWPTATCLFSAVLLLRCLLQGVLARRPTRISVLQLLRPTATCLSCPILLPRCVGYKAGWLYHDVRPPGGSIARHSFALCFWLVEKAQSW